MSVNTYATTPLDLTSNQLQKLSYTAILNGGGSDILGTALNLFVSANTTIVSTGDVSFSAGVFTFNNPGTYRVTSVVLGEMDANSTFITASTSTGTLRTPTLAYTNGASQLIKYLLLDEIVIISAAGQTYTPKGRNSGSNTIVVDGEFLLTIQKIQ